MRIYRTTSIPPERAVAFASIGGVVLWRLCTIAICCAIGTTFGAPDCAYLLHPDAHRPVQPTKGQGQMFSEGFLGKPSLKVTG